MHLLTSSQVLNIVHRDIEPKHIAQYGGDGLVCIFDFSSAVFLPQAQVRIPEEEDTLIWYSGGAQFVLVHESWTHGCSEISSPKCGHM